MRINYLTWLRSRLGTDHEILDIRDDIKTIADLMDSLQHRGEPYSAIFKERDIIFASSNGRILNHSEKIKNTDDISFFSMIAGG